MLVERHHRTTDARANVPCSLNATLEKGLDRSVKQSCECNCFFFIAPTIVSSLRFSFIILLLAHPFADQGPAYHGRILMSMKLGSSCKYSTAIYQ